MIPKSEADRIETRWSTVEEAFKDASKATARAGVLSGEPGAEGVEVSVARNHHWMDPDSIWYIVRWVKTRGES